MRSGKRDSGLTSRIAVHSRELWACGGLEMESQRDDVLKKTKLSVETQ